METDSKYSNSKYNRNVPHSFETFCISAKRVQLSNELAIQNLKFEILTSSGEFQKVHIKWDAHSVQPKRLFADTSGGIYESSTNLVGEAVYVRNKIIHLQ